MKNNNLNTIYINKDDISSAEVYRIHKVAHIYHKTFPETKFLGLIWNEEETRYSTSSMPMHRDWGSKTMEDALFYFSIRLKNGDDVMYRKNPEFFSIDQKNDIFLKTYVIITTKGGKKYTRFFDLEEDVENYLSDVGISNELFGLDFSNSL